MASPRIHTLVSPLGTVAWLLLLEPHLPGQALDGSIRGNNIDSSWAAIPAARATLVNSPTGTKRIAESNASGSFAFSKVEEGRFTVIVERDRFTTLARSFSTS